MTYLTKLKWMKDLDVYSDEESGSPLRFFAPLGMRIHQNLSDTPC